MITSPNWRYKPYIPYDRLENTGKPYICSIKPGKNSICGEVLKASDGTVLYRPYKSEQPLKTVEFHGKMFEISKLEEDTNYEFYVKTDTGESLLRLARTSSVPGTVVNYLHPEDKAYSFSGNYLCSPSIVKLPSGRIITSMDVYGNGMPQNLTILMKSDDNGYSFSYLCELFPLFWGKLFYHKNALYILGTSTEYGDLLIGRSLDEGETWSSPTVIARGSCSPVESGFHRAPTVILNENGMLLTAIEYGTHCKNEFLSALLYSDENADLLDAASWKLSPFLPLDKSVLEKYPERNRAIEGNLVLSPEGELINFLRLELNTAVLYKADIDKPHKGFNFYRTLDFPMAHTKFEIQKKDGTYYAVGNRPPKRNVLSLYTSTDLIIWTHNKDILDYSNYDMQKVAFQYPAFIFEENNINILSRTAFGGAHSFHDSNYQTFHTINL